MSATAKTKERLPLTELRDFVARLRADLAAFDSDFALQFALGRRVPTILADRARLARLALRSLWFACVGSDSPYGLIATGGFGRGELYPHSDIDLLVLTPHPAPEVLPERIQGFLAAVWDLRYRVGHSVRSTPQLLEDAKADVILATSLMESRLITGDRQRWRELSPLLSKGAGWTPEAYLQAKLSEQSERHARYQDTTFNLEPQIKEGPGGLRDSQSTLWIARVCAGAGSFAEMERQGLLHRDERSKWAQAVDHLRCVRYALHLLAERGEDRLLFDYQPRLANLFGHAPTPGSNASIEEFMREYFRATARVSLLGERIVARVQQRLRPSKSEALGPGWCAVDGRLECTPKSKALKPLGLVHGLQWLIRRPELKAIGPEAARAIDRLLAAHKRALQGPISRGVLMELLQGESSPLRVLRLWARHGILGAMIPAFARITGRMQYDLFHVYTVDRHTLAVLEQMDNLRLGNGSEDLAEPMRIQKRIDKPHLLYLAGLFHDIAKGRGGDHSKLGAVEIRRFARALGLPAEDRELLSFLVRQHLAMSITAQKQDLHDPATIARFAKLVEQPRRLDYLYVLTVADIRGTNPKLWNGWKARLLGDLHGFTEQYLRSGEMASSTPRKAARIRREAMEMLLGEGFGRDQLQTLWADFPPECFQRQSADQLRWQSGALLQSNREPDKPLAAVRKIGSTGAREIFVYTRDQDGIFATLAALLDRLHLAVVGARILTSPGGWAMDSFQVVDLDTRWTDSMTRNIEIQMRLELALAESPLKPRMAKKNLSRQQRHFYFPPEINLRSLESGEKSELLLACSDQPGLLTRVALALLSCSVNVHTARIATFGERVEDRFLLSNQRGRALTKTQTKELTRALAEQLVSEDG